MFTGIIENLGKLVKTERNGSNVELYIESTLTPELKVDQSVAHNGICLTVVEIYGDSTYRVTAIDETIKKTALRHWKEGDPVNLERCMQMNGRLDGHTNEQPVVLVGKGVVYDTGGLSLKPSNFMDDMKSDMGGAAAVIGTMSAIAEAQLPVHVIGLVPATDNRPGGNAVTPGDVIKISDGTTVEVLNTDAEGRLILSDALVYAKRYNPSLVIDLATLTGAAARAIGRYAIVGMGNADRSAMTSLQEAGFAVNERIVEFPFWDEYKELLKSPIADLKNLGGPEAGAITAGKFLEHFTDYPYIHLDIAGPAYLKTRAGYQVEGGTGVGVRLLYHFLRNA